MVVGEPASIYRTHLISSCLLVLWCGPAAQLDDHAMLWEHESVNACTMHVAGQEAQRINCAEPTKHTCLQEKHGVR